MPKANRQATINPVSTGPSSRTTVIDTAALRRPACPHCARARVIYRAITAPPRKPAAIKMGKLLKLIGRRRNLNITHAPRVTMLTYNADNADNAEQPNEGSA
jgi:hypothetical protein